MLAVHVLFYASTLSYMPNVEFHSDRRVKDNRIANFPCICKSRQEKRSEHKCPIRDMGCKENKHLIKYHRATAERMAPQNSLATEKLQIEIIASLQVNPSQETKNLQEVRLCLVPFLPGLAAKVTEQCKVSPYNFPSLSILHINFSLVKHCYF